MSRAVSWSARWNSKTCHAPSIGMTQTIHLGGPPRAQGNHVRWPHPGRAPAQGRSWVFPVEDPVWEAQTPLGFGSPLVSLCRVSLFLIHLPGTSKAVDFCTFYRIIERLGGAARPTQGTESSLNDEGFWRPLLCPPHSQHVSLKRGGGILKTATLKRERRPPHFLSRPILSTCDQRAGLLETQHFVRIIHGQLLGQGPHPSPGKLPRAKSRCHWKCSGPVRNRGRRSVRDGFS